MKRLIFVGAMLVAGLSVFLGGTIFGQSQTPAKTPATLSELGSAFTYQGRLLKEGAPVDGVCDVRAGVFDAASDGASIGSSLDVLDVPIVGGLFTIQVDFGAGAFDGNSRWLEIGTRCPAGSGEFSTLTPRQQVTPAPYALFAVNAPWGGILDIPSGLADGVDNDTTYTPGDGLSLEGTEFSVDTSTIQRRVSETCSPGEAIRVVNTDGTVMCQATGGGGGWSLTGNSGTNPGTNFVGTTDNQPFELRVNGQRALRLEPNATSPNILGSYGGNEVTAGVHGATISGGGTSGSINRVTDHHGAVGGGANNQVGNGDGNPDNSPYNTVSGGQGNIASGGSASVGGGGGNTASGAFANVSGGGFNVASGQNATIGGGDQNTASGSNAAILGGGLNQATKSDATVGGGSSNQATGNITTIGGGRNNIASEPGSTVGGGAANTASGLYSFVGGGIFNTAQGEFSTVVGGNQNQALGAYSMVAGGESNTAEGRLSYAAGNRAKATHDGSFVWADSSTFDNFFSSNDHQFSMRASGGTRIFSNSDATVGVQLAPGGNSWSTLSDRSLKSNFVAVDLRDVLERLAVVPITTWNLQSQDSGIQHMGPMAQDFYEAFGLGESDRYISSSDADGIALAAIQGLHQMVQERDERLASMERRLETIEKETAAPMKPMPALAWALSAGLGLLAVGLVVGRLSRSATRGRSDV